MLDVCYLLKHFKDLACSQSNNFDMLLLPETQLTPSTDTDSIVKDFSGFQIDLNSCASKYRSLVAYHKPNISVLSLQKEVFYIEALVHVL